MRENEFLTRLASGTLVITAVAGTALLIGGVASAAPLPRSLGATTVQAADVTTTSTTLEISPPSPANDPNTTETLTATLTPDTAVGSVQFSDGSTTLGDPVTLTNGTASTTITLASGEHSLSAVFTPTDTTAFSASTSNTLDYTVNGGHRGQHSNGGDGRGTRGNRGVFGAILGGNRGILDGRGFFGGLQGILGELWGFLGNLGSTVSN